MDRLFGSATRSETSKRVIQDDGSRQRGCGAMDSAFVGHSTEVTKSGYRKSHTGFNESAAAGFVVKEIERLGLFDSRVGSINRQ